MSTTEFEEDTRLKVMLKNAVIGAITYALIVWCLVPSWVRTSWHDWQEKLPWTSHVSQHVRQSESARKDVRTIPDSPSKNIA